jgi:hypothetical protein
LATLAFLLQRGRYLQGCFISCWLPVGFV